MRRVLGWMLVSLGLPCTLYAKGKYIYINDATVFPAKNVKLLKIADGISLQDAFFNVWDEIILEKGVVLGHQVMFLTGEHAVDENGAKKEPFSGGKIVVRNGAWIGSRAILLAGVTIGEGAMVGAGSVVTKSVPDHEFWAGNPAGFIRRIIS